MVNQYNNVNKNNEHQKIVKQAMAELMPPTKPVPHKKSSLPPEPITIQPPKKGIGFFNL